MVVAALLFFGPFCYALGRTWYIRSGAVSFAEVPFAQARVMLLCMLVMPVGLIAFGGAWLWWRHDRDVAREDLAARLRKARPERKREYRL